MDSKTMIFECLNCEETYLADNFCDGYKCPRCNGHIKPLGFIEGIEEGIREMKNKIKRAKKNGLIRNYYRYNIAPKPPLPPNLNYKYGVDLSDKKDHTINININTENIDKDKLIEQIIKNINNPNNPKRSGYIG